MRPRLGGRGRTIEANLVPLDDSAFDLEEGQADARLPILRALQNEVCAQHIKAQVSAWCVRLRPKASQPGGGALLSVSRILVLEPAYASGKW